MADDNLILEYLRQIRSKIDSLSDDMIEVKGRLGILESQYASLSTRLDRIDMWLERVERRLDLHEGVS